MYLSLTESFGKKRDDNRRTAPARLLADHVTSVLCSASRCALFTILCNLFRDRVIDGGTRCCPLGAASDKNLTADEEKSAAHGHSPRSREPSIPFVPLRATEKRTHVTRLLYLYDGDFQRHPACINIFRGG
ncbi:hypothetical protein MTO96_001037 [Rhipicephalus appendiculatus]